MRALAALSLSLFAVAASAESDFEIQPGGSQAQFRSVAKDIAATLDYKALGPAEASGLTGFSIGAFATYAPTSDKAAWAAVTGEDVDAIGVVGVSAVKGLPFNIDIGAFYSQVPKTDAKLFGGEVRWAVLPGGVATPAVAVRGSYTKLSGEDQLEYDAFGFDVSVSKGFAFLTPYAGAGYSFGTVATDPLFGYEDEDVNQAKLFLGARIALGFLQLTPEYTRSGDTNAYSLRTSIGF
ncbi:MAG: hypothetical protein Q8Q73_09130 [Stagnimonas sp.]|nr:hypothetical protein [Stagnimonas sp.]